MLLYNNISSYKSLKEYLLTEPLEPDFQGKLTDEEISELEKRLQNTSDEEKKELESKLKEKEKQIVYLEV